MNMKVWLNAYLQNPVKKPLPILSFPGTQILGMTVPEMIGSAENQASCMKAIADRFDTAASVSLMDLSVEAEAFGSTVKYSDGEVPTVTGALVVSEEDAEALTVPKVGTGRTGICIEAITCAKSLITDRPILAGVIGPFSLAGRLISMTEIMINCLTEPEMTHITLKKAAAFILDYVKALKAAGADGVVFAEPAAGLLSPAMCEEFSSTYLRSIVSAVKDENFLVIYHNCGNTIPLIESILGIGADGYHFGNAVDIGTVLAKMPRDIPVFGNLSPAEYFRGGTPETVAEATRAMLQVASGYQNYIPSSGCDIPPQTPLENIEAFFRTVAAFQAGN